MSSGFGDLFGQDPFGMGGLGDLLGGKSKDKLPCGDKHSVGSNGLCHRCGKKVEEPKQTPKKKASMRKKMIEGVAYIHADDVATILEANNVQPALARQLRQLNK